MLLKLSVLLSALFVVAACSHSLARVPEYSRFLDRNVKEKRLYDEGRTVLYAKVLAVDHDLKRLQEKQSPGHSVDFEPGTAVWMVALTVRGREIFSQHDIIFELSGESAVKVSEVSDQNLVESMYPFAFPFYRLFRVEFATQSSRILNSQQNLLSIKSPVGALNFDVGRMSEYEVGGDT